MYRAMLAAAILSFAGGAAVPAPSPDAVEPVTQFVGEMAVPMPGGGIDKSRIDNALRFEPIQSFDDMFLRDDVVYLMRHGPTDWSKLDKKEVSPTDCENQRLLSDQGAKDMRDLGALLAFNDITFGRVVVSQWCRNQQTYEQLQAGYDQVDDGIWETFAKADSADLNLLLSLQGAPNVTNLRELVSTWDGGDGKGPMLVISHFTNIQELTEFAAYEGEILVVDPKRDNRVLGYLRLKTAEPDVGHFAIANDDAPFDEDEDSSSDE
ncbi:Phosphohistidine phosphatase SixA [Palleronia marisminoris]|uniref:Histidine phosphatase superfamily (Branch 1) n=1 Tax=Palleronia marisminoris TaxID=315423 RepID=A0A1Y5TNU0_9RHOB|nr:histidine phosphatase family protein [Palleronia marisminoris]SFH43216.1 Phosphohistidine phosphatase SixA [Palleronia marisminoris]SLN66489.1 hypothetical protein PAM7066_03323 [Palleronia marisminoris]